MPSSQGLELLVWTHAPSEHESLVQTLPSSQFRGVPRQNPPEQISSVVQRLSSLQGVPYGLAGFEQVPAAGSQLPASWHWSDAWQMTGLLPTHRPLWH